MTYTAKFWRGNPQFKNGGYETTRTITAENKREAMKQVKLIEQCLYGTMELLEIVREQKPKAEDGKENKSK